MWKMALLLNDSPYNKFQRWTLLPCTLSSWLCLQLFLHLVLIQSGMLVVVMGLRLESISVPRSGIKGSSITLGCEYRLDDVGEKLYSLKWYKDNHEFFRYSPQGPQPITTFPQPGVLVDSTEYRPLTANRVVFKLKNLRLNSGGTYKCEISAEKTFKTLSKESNLSVIVLPDPPTPRLKITPPNAQLGDRIRGNCSFPKSFPPAKLTFLVNGAKVNNSEDVKVKAYEPRVDGVIEDYNLVGGSSTMSGISSSNGIGKQYQYQQQNQQISSSYGSSGGGGGRDNIQVGIGAGNTNGMEKISEKTYTSVMGIEFRLDRHHFVRRGQVLTIRCVASVVDQVWDAETNITIHNYQPSQLSTSSGQNRYSSGSEYLRPTCSQSLSQIFSEVVRLGGFLIAWSIFQC